MGDGGGVHDGGGGGRGDCCAADGEAGYSSRSGMDTGSEVHAGGVVSGTGDGERVVDGEGSGGGGGQGDVAVDKLSDCAGGGRWSGLGRGLGGGVPRGGAGSGAGRAAGTSSGLHVDAVLVGSGCRAVGTARVRADASCWRARSCSRCSRRALAASSAGLGFRGVLGAFDAL